MESAIEEITEDTLRDMQLRVEYIEGQGSLYRSSGFKDRADALDTIDFDVLWRIEELQPAGGESGGLPALRQLRQRAERVRARLQAADEALFRELRADIRSGNCTSAALRDQIDSYIGYSSIASPQDNVGYDHLDVLINGLLLAAPPPDETREREPEMVYYQPIPAAIIFQLTERAHITPSDLFYDLGSGLGQVCILVNLLTGARTKGVEFQPAYCDYATRCARDLNLSGVEFINQDAREADYSDGTVFFMYTPFEGEMLQEVLGRLKREAQKRPIRVGTYGPCTLQASRQSWLQGLDQHGDHIYNLAVFRSV